MEKYFRVSLVLVMMVIISCNKDKKTDINTENKNIDLNQTDSRVVVEFSDQKIKDVYHYYLKIKEALVNSNSEAVQTESKKAEAIIGESEEEKQLKATLKLISLTKDVEKQRGFFVALTSEIENLVSNAEIKSGAVYKQFCPMAFEGEGGYWLSDSKEIRNPYFGSKMLKCGSVKNVIK